jgi:hypothetical protein
MYQRTNLKPCKICLKPVNPEEKNCPYCGSKLKKDLLPKLIIGVLALTLIGSLAIPKKSYLQKEREKIVNAPVNMVNVGELAKILDTKHVDVEILNKIGKIEGKIVELQLQVFVATYMSDYYRIVTIPSAGIPGTLLSLYPKNKKESEYLKKIKPGHTIRIKGKIKGTLMKRIKIDPAFII